MADGAVHTNSGASTSVTVLNSLMSTCSDGPAVSLNGSPTVSPTTAALCVGLPFPPYSPVSMNFLALSQAPPPLLSRVAMRIPAIVPTMRNDATVSAPTWNSTLKTRPTAIRSEEHTSELQSRLHLVCRLLLEKKKKEDTLDYCNNERA